MADPTPEPFATGRLDVGDGHVLYYEEVGAREGTPVVYLHGGPGAGCTPGARRSFDLQRHRAVLFDQRAAGQSTPHASEEGVHWASIDMDHHLDDIERLREHLGIERWIVFAVSWGSVLGAAYAERHPERVTALVLAAVTTGPAADVDWLTVHAGRFFPAEWHAFRDQVPAELREERLVDAYNTLLMDPDPVVREAAAVAWCRWEDAHVATTPGVRPNPRFAEARSRLGFARQVTHCWRHDSWLAPDEIVATPPDWPGSRDGSSTDGSTSAAPSTLPGGSTRRGPAASSSSSMTKVTAGRPWRGTGAACSPTSPSPTGHGARRSTTQPSSTRR